jgi:hypothetical protein
VYDPEITTSCYKGLLQEYVILCNGLPNKWSPLAVLRFPAQMSPLAPCGSVDSQSIVTKYDALPHSTEHDSQPIAFLISEQLIPYYDRTPLEKYGFVSQHHIGGFSTKREYANTTHISIQYHI